MKMLVNKYDRNIRLVGLEDVLIEGKTGEALGERPRLYYRFAMGGVECLWSGQDWSLEDYEPREARRGEREEFRAWLRGRLNERGYSAYGLSIAMGYSQSWFSNMLQGRSRLRKKDVDRLAEELGVPVQTLRAKRGRISTIKKDV